jgi:hypothetical protein
LGARLAGVRLARARECRPLSDTRWPFPAGRRWSPQCAAATSQVAQAPRFVAVVAGPRRCSWLRRSTGLRRPSTSRSPMRGGRFSGVDRWPVLGVYRGPQRPVEERLQLHIVTGTCWRTRARVNLIRPIRITPPRSPAYRGWADRSCLVAQGGVSIRPGGSGGQAASGSIPNRSFTAIRSFCLHPR